VETYPQSRKAPWLSPRARHLLSFAAMLAAVFYFWATAALWFWLQKNPYNQIGYLDLAIPTNWSELRAKRGQAAIARGLAELEDGTIGPAIFNLRVGLARHPDDTAARLTLSRVLAENLVFRPALTYLQAGLTLKEYPTRDYLAFFFSLAYQSQNFDVAIEGVEKLLARPDTLANRALHLDLVRERASLLLASGQAEAALTVAKEMPSRGGERAYDLEAACLLALDQAAEALEVIQAARSTAQPNGRIIQLQAQALRQLKQENALRQVVSEISIRFPTDAELNLFGVAELARAGLDVDARNALKRYFILFLDQPLSVARAAFFLSEVPSSALVEICLEESRAQGEPIDGILFFFTQALIKENRIPEAELAHRRWLQALGEELPKEAILWREWLQRLLPALRTDRLEDQVEIVNFFRGRVLPPVLYAETAAALKQAERIDSAYQVLESGLNLYSQTVTLQQAMEGVRPAWLALQPQRRQGQVADASQNQTAAPVEPALLSQRGAVQRVEEMVAEGDWQGAAALIAMINRDRPTWLRPREEEELAFMRLRIAVMHEDTLTAINYIALYLGSDQRRGSRALALAQELSQAGNPSRARMLARAVADRMPQFEEAIALLSAIEMAEPSGTAAAPTASGPARIEESTRQPVVVSTRAFDEIEAAIATQDWTGAQLWVSAVSRASPPWLARRQGDFDLLRIRVMVGRGDGPEAFALIRRFLADNGRPGAERMVEAAKKFDEAGNRLAAEFLARQALAQVYPRPLDDPWLEQFQ
jgi:hypothetical protein